MNIIKLCTCQKSNCGIIFYMCLILPKFLDKLWNCLYFCTNHIRNPPSCYLPIHRILSISDHLNFKLNLFCKFIYCWNYCLFNSYISHIRTFSGSIICTLFLQSLNGLSVALLSKLSMSRSDSSTKSINSHASHYSSTTSILCSGDSRMITLTWLMTSQLASKIVCWRT